MSDEHGAFALSVPPELIAYYPAASRSASRMMVVDRGLQAIRHCRFTDLVDFVCPPDIVVLNNTKVRSARLRGVVAGRAVELLLVERVAKNRYRVKAKPGKLLRPGARIDFPPHDLRAEAEAPELAVADRTLKTVRFLADADIEEQLDDIGEMPLPPYIKRPVTAFDRQRYQTVYAAVPGAIAAPTAGLHFTPEILAAIQAKQVAVTSVTLHVGLGTFAPLRTAVVSEHQMHAEAYDVCAAAAQAINAARSCGGRILAVGTTVCRVLETVTMPTDGAYAVAAGRGTTACFIYPPYDFRGVNMLLTNFHLPQTTLLLLVCAFAGRELAQRAYAEAVAQRYRFFSYGDCMLIV